MKIQCPSCDQRLEIPEELAGQTIECPACNESLAVPSLATPPPSPVQVQQSAPQVTASEKPKSSIPKWAIASVAGIAVLVVCLIMFFTNDPNGISSSEPTAVKTDGESQQSTTAAEVKPIERVAGAKAPDISIHEAAEEGDLEAIKQHLAAGTDVDVKGWKGMTPLHFSVRANQKEAVELLLARGADVEARKDADVTPLMLCFWAAGIDEAEEIVEVLISNGADINAKDSFGNSALWWATGAVSFRSKEEIAVIKLLLKNGADVNAENVFGNPPLNNIFPRFDKDEEIAVLLRKHGARTKKELKAEKFSEIVKLLLNRTTNSKADVETVKRYLSSGADVNKRNKFGGSLLHIASVQCDKPLVRLLIANGADVNAKTISGRTPLDRANKNNISEIADLLRKHGAKTGEELKAAGK